MPIKILFVDDEPKLQPVIGQLFRREIRKKEYDLIFALNGLEALDKLQADPQIDIVLTDINMPKMNGLRLLTRLQEVKPDLNPVLTSVVVSAYGDMENIRKAMNSGAFDFLTKPLDFDDVKVTLTKAIEHTQRLKRAIEQELLAQESLRKMNEELERRVKERTAELAAINTSLKASNAELDAFAHTVAHDLKNPLGVIIGYADLLFGDSSEMDQEEIHMFLKTIRRSGRKAVNIIEELLLLAGVRKENIKMLPLDMADIVTQAQGRLILMIEEYQGEIILPDIWPVAEGYAPWVEEIWTNYLSNGLKYGGRPPCLKLGATPEPDGMIRFWVQDNGAGLTPEARATLFAEFIRLNKVRVEGHGLGLSIVRRIVEKLGGRVGVESNGVPGQGSVFYFTLPDIGNAPHS